MQESERIKLRSEGQQRRIVIDPAQLSDAGQYSVRITGQKAKSSAQLTVAGI